MDVFGDALLEKIAGKTDLHLSIISPDFEEDQIPVDYLFRTFEEMPIIEQTALQKCKGKVLDIGACAGSHALWLQENKYPVKAIDISAGAVNVMQQRGVKNAQNINFFDIKEEKYDTLLFLMNGIGITGKIDQLNTFFEQAKKLLSPNGQILLDSSDIIYLFDEIDLNANYYGEMNYQIRFNEKTTTSFNWLFISFELLEEYAQKNGFSCEKLVEGTHYDYLARLTIEA